MKAKQRILGILIMSVITSQQLFGQPTITSFSPTVGSIGSTIILTGTNFDPTPANNVVLFGAAQAIVTEATTTDLTVTVPVGASNQPISVRVGGQTAYSVETFTVNLVQNGGFEQETPGNYTGSTFWWITAENGCAATFSIVNDAPSGTNACEINVTAHPTDAPRWSVNVTNPYAYLLPGKYYRISFWAKTDTNGKQISYWLSHGTEWAGADSLPITSSWTQYYTDFYNASADSCSVGLYGLHVGQYWFDEVEIVELPAVNVTFNVDLTQPIDIGYFVVGTDVLYVSGTFTNEFKDNNNWDVPGTGETLILTDVDNDKIFTGTIAVLENYGELKYKYFKNAGWNYGDNVTGDRTITISNIDYPTNDIWLNPPPQLTAVFKKATVNPVIDGIIDGVWTDANSYNIDRTNNGETPTLGISGETFWKGLWTPQGIYVLIIVNDDVFFPAYMGANSFNTWEYDKPEIYFDVNPVLKDGLGAANNMGHHQIAPPFIEAEIGGTPVVYNDGAHGFLVTGNAYVAEYFVPFTKLLDQNGLQVSENSTIGFDINIIDRDEEATNQQRAVWANLISSPWYNMDECGLVTLEKYNYDLAVLSIDVPITLFANPNVPITATVKNMGLNPIESFTLSYTIDGNNEISEIINQRLEPEEVFTYTFSNSANFSSVASHDILVNATLIGEEFINDNQLLKTINVEPPKQTAVIKKAAVTPVIDGIIDAEWANANTYNIDQNFTIETPSLGASGTTTWKGLWTNNGIYLLLQVNDDVFFPAYLGAIPFNHWNYDKPEIYFDVNTLLNDGLGAAHRNGHHQVAPSFIAGQIDGTPVIDADGTHAFLVSDPTYVAEYFVPFTKLLDQNGEQVNQNASIGFDVTINDNDLEATGRQRAVWANRGTVAESFINMDSCGIITLEKFNKDLAVLSIDVPVWVFSNPNTPIIVTLKNMGLNPVESFTLSYTIDGNTAISEVINRRLEPEEIFTYTFANTADFSVVASHDILINAILGGEESMSDNQLQKTINVLPPSQLLAHFSFTGNTNDESGNDHHGTASNTMLVNDRFGNPNRAMQFNGTNSFINLGSNLNLINNTNKFTFSAWVNPKALLTWTQHTIFGERNAGDNYQFCIWDKYVHTTLWTGGTEASYTTHQVNLNSWQLLTATYDGSNFTYYVDGQLVQIFPASGFIDSNPSELLIGTWDGTNGWFDGIMDDIRIYDGPLTQSEITALYQEGGWESYPKISSFAPTLAPIGGTVTITGSNFSTTIENNTVMFGAVQATITAATATELTVTVPAGTVTNQPILVTVAGQTTNSSSLFEVNFVPNGGFENSVLGENTATNWSLFATDGCTADFTIVSDAYSDSNALQSDVTLSGTPPPNSVQIQHYPPSIIIDKAGRYKLSFWAKATAAGQIQAMVCKSNWDYVNGITVPALTTDWQQYTFNFEAAAPETYLLQFWLQSNDSYWLDDVEIVEQSSIFLTFNVDMTQPINDGSFTAGTDMLYVTGSFASPGKTTSGWDEPGTGRSVLLTDENFDNIFTGTVAIDTNYGELIYKYFINLGWFNGDNLTGFRTIAIGNVDYNTNDVWISPVPKLSAILKKATIAPTIDGIIDAEWANANTYNIDQNFVNEAPTLGATGTTTWKGLWTNDGIYLLLQINDDVFFPAYAGANPGFHWVYDKPEIYFDVNTLLNDGLGAANWSGHHQVAPPFIAGQTDGTPVNDANGTHAFLVTDPTYVAEYFVPFIKLLDQNGVQINQNATIGFDVTIDDNDLEATGRQRSVWANTGTVAESWFNMDGCGMATFEKFNNDLAVLSIDLPVWLIVNSNQPIIATVKNLGINPIESFNISYSIDGNPEIIEEVSHHLEPGELFTYTFLDSADFSIAAPHELIVTAILSGEESINDNQLLKTINVQPPSQLLAHYTFTGNANDESGNDHHGTASNTMLVNDRFGNPNSAMQFNGTNSFINLGSNLNLINNTNKFSFSAWVYPTELLTWKGHTIFAERNAGDNYQFIIWDKGIFTSYWSEGIQPMFGGNTLNERVWQLLTATYDGSYITLYVDGQFDRTFPASGFIDSHPSELLIGTWDGVNDWFYGILDDIRIYDGPLTQSEITALYQEGGWETYPKISSFAPTLAPIGGTVTITGSNFSITIENNTVMFGAVQATITAATATELTVTVPAGTVTNQPIFVTVAGQTTNSSSLFEVNFVPNGGFEDAVLGTNTASNWSLFATDGCTADFTIVSDAYSGSNALQSDVTLSGTPPANSVQVQHYPPSIIIDKAGRYKLSFWAKATAAGQIQAMVCKSNWDYVNGITVPALTTDWQQYTFNFEVAAPETYLLQFWLQSTDSYWLDDVEIIEQSAVNLNFNVDMTQPIDSGLFVVGTDVLYVSGTFTNEFKDNGSWDMPGTGESLILTDDNFDNIYTGAVAIDSSYGALRYKYFINAGWLNGDNVTGDRTITISNVDYNTNDVWKLPNPFGFTENFNDNALSGWNGSSQYILEEKNAELKVTADKTGWDDLSLNVYPISIVSNPYLSVRIKTNDIGKIRLTFVDINGIYADRYFRGVNIIGDGEYHTYFFDFTNKLVNSQNIPLKADEITKVAIAFNQGSYFNGEVYFDDLRLGSDAVLTHNANLNFLGINEDCNSSAPKTVTIKIVNTRNNPMTDFNVGYSIDGGPAINETFYGTINPGDTASYTFASKANLNTTEYSHTFVIKATIDNSTDGNMIDNNLTINKIMFGTYSDKPGWKSYNSCNGLIENNVWSLSQDIAGNIYACTFKGINKISHSKIETYTTADGLISNYSWTSIASKDGSVWFPAVSVIGGITQYKEGNFIKHFPFDSLRFDECSYQDDQGNLWFGSYSGNGIAKYDGINWTHLTQDLNPSVLAIGQAPNGSFLFGGWEKTISYNGTTFTDFLIKDINLIGTHEIFRDNKKRTWFCTDDELLSLDSLGNWLDYTLNVSAIGYIEAITQDTKGNLWFGGSLGVASFDGNIWQIFDHEDGLIPGAIYSILADKDGSLWFGSYSQGLSHYVYLPINKAINASICQGDSYHFNGKDLIVSGTYIDTLSSIIGVDSIVTLTLNVVPIVSKSINATICQGNSYHFNGKDLTMAGIFKDTLPSLATGCDSIVTLTLNVNPILTKSINATICQGDSYRFDNKDLTLAGTYADTLPSLVTGCDSIVTLILNVNPIITKSINAIICQGDIYRFDNKDISMAGIYKDTLASLVTGCDSIVTLTLNVNPVYTDTIMESICKGDIYILGTQSLTIAGMYKEIFPSQVGCDSTITLLLKVDSVPSKPSKPLGIIALDNSIGTSTYTITELINTVEYSWVLLPAQAGSISGTGTTSTVNWSPTYFGTAKIAVRGSNNCGYGLYSDSLLVNVTDNPKAIFSYSTTGLIVTFLNQSINAEKYNWDFGDGITSQTQNPVHTYNTDGYYQVCLKAFNESTNQVDEACIGMAVGDTNKVCIAEFDSHQSGSTVLFNNISQSNFTNFIWNFGDGQYSTSEDPEHIYSKGGFYTVIFTGYDSIKNCGNTISHDIFIDLGQPVSCKADFEVFINQGVVSFANKSSGNYSDILWSFGDYSYSTDKNATVHTYTKSGYYNACITTYDSISGCMDDYCQELFISINQEAICKADYSYIVIGATVSFTSKAIGNISEYMWDFGDGSYGFLPNIEHTYAKPGFYKANLTIFDSVSNCMNTIVKTIVVTKGAPTLCQAQFTYFISENNVVFSNSSLGNYTDAFWDFGDGSYSTNFDDSHKYNDPGFYSVTLTIYDFETDHLSDITQSVLITSEEVPICQAEFSFISNQNNITFNNESVGESTDFFWDFGDGKYSFDENPNNTYEYPGYYEVSLSIFNNLNGCFDNKTSVVFVYNPEIAMCKAEFNYYPIGNTVYFTSKATGDYSQQFWDFGNGWNSNDEDPVHTFMESGYYEIAYSVIDSVNGCFDTQTKTIFVQGETGGTTNYSIKADFSYLPGNGTLIVLFNDKSMGEVTNWYWDFGDNTPSSNLQNPEYIYASNDYYRVCLTASNSINQETKCDFIAVGDVSQSSTAFFTYFADSVTSTARFKNQSLGNIVGYSWDFGDGISSTQKNPSHTYADTGYYAVCLTTTSKTGVLKTYCNDVRIGNTISNPCLFSCVWPGDANSDLEANHYDIMTLGLNYNMEGPKRDSASIQWYGQFAQNWSTSQIDGTNNKHGDCNGDGTINFDDLQAIELNFAMSHYWQPDVKSSLWKISCEWLPEEVNVEENQRKAKAILTNELKNKANNLYAIGFEVEVIGGEKIDWNSIKVSFENCWIGIDGQNMITITQMDSLKNMLYIGITRTDQKNTSGSGEVAIFDFKFKEGYDASGVSFNATSQGGIVSTGEATSVGSTISLDLSSPLSICAGETLLLDAGSGFETYTWSTGATDTSRIEVNESGVYYVTVTNSTGATASDTIIVTVHELPLINLGNDVTKTDSLVLEVSKDFAGYLWSTGDTLPSITVTETGDYWVQVLNDFGCIGSDTINVTIITGINRDIAKSITIFPNPNNGKFWLVYEFNKFTSTFIEIVNTDGSTVWRNEVKDFSGRNYLIDAGKLEKGVYFIKVFDTNRISTKRFVIL